MRTAKLRAAAPAGFTLIEILLAMGILAVGMVMVAAAFPTVITQSKETHFDTMATMISENAVAVCQVALTTTNIRCRDATPTQTAVTTTAFQPIDDAFDNTCLNATMRLHSTLRTRSQPAEALTNPVSEDWENWEIGDSQYGWLLLARLVSGSNYQFFVIPYAKFLGGDYETPHPNDRPEPYLAPANITMDTSDPNEIKATFADANLLAMNSPVVRAGLVNGEVRTAYVINIVGPDTARVAVLSNDLGFQAGDPPIAVFIVPALASEGPSPAIGCFMFSAQLQP